MSYINRIFAWDFDALKRFYEMYVVKWINSSVNWTEEQKKQARENLGFAIFNSTQNFDYSDDVAEIWLSNMPAGRVCCKYYNNKVYLNSLDSPIYSSCSIANAKNYEVYPVKVYAGATSQYPTGTIVGYVVFKDVDSFKTKASSAVWENVNRSRQEDLLNSPFIAIQLGIVSAAKATIATSATKATIATNVVDAQTTNASFIEELYLFGSGVDQTKTYRISAVARNHSTYKYSIVISDSSNNIVCYLIKAADMPSNPVYIPAYSNSNIEAYAIVRWDEFDDGSNNSCNITLLPRVFDINFSPTIKALIDIEDAKSDVADIQEDITTMQADIDSLKNIEVHTYDRSDFWQGYRNTSTAQIGDTISLPAETTTHVTSDSAAGYLTLEVKRGETIEAAYKALSNRALHAWILLDSNKKVIAWADPQTSSDPFPTLDYLETPLVLNITNDGYLILQFPKSNYNDNESCLIKHIKKGSGTVTEDNIEVCVPDEVIAVVGDTLQLYYHSIYRCANYQNYAVKVVCKKVGQNSTIGAQYPRYFEVTPTATGEYALTFSIYDNNHNLLGEKTSRLKVVGIGGNPQSELNVLCLGASATEFGQWASEFKRRLTGSGGNPAGSGKTGVNFVGRMDVTFAGQQVNLEATGGYTFSSYTDTTTNRYRFYVEAGREPTIQIGEVYEDGASPNPNEYTVTEINISPGSGGYFSCTCDITVDLVPIEGETKLKIKGGTATVSYTSFKHYRNPFLYNGVINMQQYATDYCNGRIDVVYTELSGNGSVPYTDDFTSRMSSMQTLITQIRTVFPNCKFCIGLFWNPDVRGGMGVNYGTNGSWSDVYGIKYTNMNLCNALQKYITDNNMSSYVYIVNWLNEFDTLNDMMQTTKNVNVRSTVTEIFGVNGVHPATIGYYQMADTAWRLFIAKFCQST